MNRATALSMVVMFAVLMALFAFALTYRPNPSVLPSALVGKPLRDFDLPPLTADDGRNFGGLALADVTAGEVSIVNFWASWCGPCRAEHALLTRLADEDGARLYGVNYKDKPETAVAFLDELGNPFARVGFDAQGRTSIDWGVSGVPETFVVDGDGRVVARHVGPLTVRVLEREIRPALAKAREEPLRPHAPERSLGVLSGQVDTGVPSADTKE